MAVSISQRYNKKKRDTLSKRSVGFELTLEEFKTLYSKSDVCDYTGEAFSTSSVEYHKSIERIDKNLPYRRDNCCVVTVKDNQLKDMLEEDKGRLKVQDLELFNKIKETLESKTRQKLVNKYFPDVKIGENNEEQMNTEKQNIEISIDFSNPQMSQNKLIEFTEQVEAECPVSKQLGVTECLIGEGIVWVPKDKEYCWDSGNWFKVKGEKHSVSKVKKLASVDPEKLESIEKFVEYAVTENRLEQGLNEVGLDQKLVGAFIGWINKDINKEEGDTLEANNLSMKDVGKRCSDVTRKFYLSKLNEV